jgi:eukaryotic-like serine/threonine-protein kinase
MVMGTAGYMSPEQAQGHVQEIDHRSDIFSFGCILFEALTRHRLFVDTSVIESLHKVVYESPPPIKNFNPSVPPDLERIVRLCLAKDPEQRYQNIKDVTIALKKIRFGSGTAEILRSQVTEQSAGPTSNVEYIVGEIKRHKRSAAIALSALIIATSAFAYFSNLKPNRTPVLTDQDTILVADFDNKTGDKDFDDTLRRALVMQLEQSPFFTIFSDQRVAKTLGYMMRPPTERLMPEIAREICQREGLKAMLTGSIAPLGTHYYLTLEAIDPRTGDALVRTQTEVESKEKVLRTLGEAATELRQKLGESLSSVQKFDAPLEQATTSSLEALKDFSLAMRQIGPDALATRIALYNRAIELDPNFALAHARLSMTYFASQQGELAMEAARKAFELRDRVSEWERFDASIRYYQLVTVEWDKAVMD